MKKSILTLAVAGFVAISTAFAPAESKLVSKKGHINFFSHTAVEDISADNYKVVASPGSVNSRRWPSCRKSLRRSSGKKEASR